ncbi:hypothetical protein ACFDTO_19030 [Microbacteriaceae bacterium 4G12]
MRFATEQDVDKLLHFLGQARIHDIRIRELYSQFMLLEDEQNRIQAVIGYEQADCACLLRSLVLSPVVDQLQFLQFFQVFLEQLKEREIRELYLLTTNEVSLPLFQMFGFRVVEHSAVPLDITKLEHYVINKKQTNVIVLNCQLFTELSTD